MDFCWKNEPTFVSTNYIHENTVAPSNMCLLVVLSVEEVEDLTFDGVCVGGGGG